MLVNENWRVVGLECYRRMGDGGRYGDCYDSSKEVGVKDDLLRNESRDVLDLEKKI